MKTLTLFILLITATFSDLYGQMISGTVRDENNHPIPFASLFVRQLGTGTPANDEGYYTMNLTEGNYHLVFSSVGYESANFEITISGINPVNFDVTLKTSQTQLNEVIVKSSRRDPAYEIIQNVIANKTLQDFTPTNTRTSLYLKATEDVIIKKKKDGVVVETSGTPDPFGGSSSVAPAEKDSVPNINMLEMSLIVNRGKDQEYKEERTAVKKYGTQEGLFIPNLAMSNVNFYNNLVTIKEVTDASLISPFNNTSILSYKFKLESTDTIDAKVVYKIKVIPRKTGNATLKGHVNIIDESWKIHSVNLELFKGSLKFYDHFRIKQFYEEINETLRMPVLQTFLFDTKLGKNKKFIGKTVIQQESIEIDQNYPDRFFSNELSITKKEAYDKDSVYWNRHRLIPLTLQQSEMIHYKDSVMAVHDSPAYKDSVEAVFNKITIGEALYHGFAFRNYKKKHTQNISSILSTVDFEVIGGFRIGPYLSNFKKWENERWLYTDTNFSMGIKNKDITAKINNYFLYDPFRQGRVNLHLGHEFKAINPNDAILNQLQRANFYLEDRISATNRIELFNGFYLTSTLGYALRQSTAAYDSETFIGEIIPDADPIEFQDYGALTSTIKISYTPNQKYMTEPNRKVILGSKFPTFSMAYKKGWNDIFKSDIDFDYVEFMIRQKASIRSMGISEYTLQTGQFLNSTNLRFIDKKRFRQSDPYLYSNPMVSFQLLDTALSAIKPYVEMHYLHRFNGALINNIPLLKKLRLSTVAGAGFLWVQESKFRHQEIFAGVEKIFKVGPRRRLKIGFLGVGAQSSGTPFKTDFKISIDLIDTWKKDWTY